MGHSVTIGGERLGAGKRMKAYLHGYERSTHNKSYLWRSTMACGTLVPFLNETALPGDTFDINLDVDVLTHPTIGPLFGNYKVQLDVFLSPVRLYQGKLHMNMLEIGLDMSKVLLPQLELRANGIDFDKPLDNQQINPSSIFSYLGIRGLGFAQADPTAEVERQFNAVPYLSYWSIYKQYYANKQEKIGAVIHRDPNAPALTITTGTIFDGNPSPIVLELGTVPTTYQNCALDDNTYLFIQATGVTEAIPLEAIQLYVQEYEQGGIPTPKIVYATDYFTDWQINPSTGTIIGSKPTLKAKAFRGYGSVIYNNVADNTDDIEPKIVTFPLKNIDDMRMAILGYAPQNTPVIIGDTNPAPYGLPMASNPTTKKRSMFYNQEGLALKTYNSDLFNNWMNTEYITGPGGISEITAIDTSGGSFTIDELNMSKKVYMMLNRIAISGGSYDDWLDAVYDNDRIKSSEEAMYMGGLIRNIVFQEVVSNSRTAEQPLGTLAGRGTLGSKKKGGHITIKVSEPSVILGIISITPNVDYSQGNQWDVNLKTMNDYHKPQLGEIGFQDLVTDQIAWFDTAISSSGQGLPVYKSAGKQPAWINYMTNVNQVRGNFADQNQQMFMTLNRRYEAALGATVYIKDMTTYIDPVKFNHIFADTRRDAQNFWAQIAVDMTARRKMSAKIMPNL